MATVGATVRVRFEDSAALDCLEGRKILAIKWEDDSLAVLFRDGGRAKIFFAAIAWNVCFRKDGSGTHEVVLHAYEVEQIPEAAEQPMRDKNATRVYDAINAQILKQLRGPAKVAMFTPARQALEAGDQSNKPANCANHFPSPISGRCYDCGQP